MSKLPKAPLQEAIFEIRWELDVDSASNQQLDTGFPLAQGKLQNIVKIQFPLYQRKVPIGLPEQLLQYQVINQFWSAVDQWPVLQLGPGIFTLNDTEANYDWPGTYYPLIKQSIDWIYEAYDGKLNVNFASLRYIDSVKIAEYGYEGKWREFVHDHFNFSFVNNFNPRGAIKGLQFDQYFELEDKSALHISMNSGKYRKTDEQALIWQTAVTKNDKFEKVSLISWVEKAHATTSSLFKEMINKNFYAASNNNLVLDFEPQVQTSALSPRMGLSRESVANTTVVGYIYWVSLSTGAKEMITKMESFKSLPANWNQEGAIPPAPETVDCAKAFIRKADKNLLPFYFTAPGPNGEIVIEFRKNNREASVYINSDGSIELLLNEGHQIAFEGPLNAHYKNLLSFING